MPDSVFRTLKDIKPADTEVQTVKEIKEIKAPSTEGSSSITHDTGLLSAYEYEKGYPFSAEYFEITNIWDKGLDGGFSDEAKTIDSFLQDMIRADKLENSTQAAKKYLKSLEREADIKETESTVKRIAKLIKFIEYKRIALDL